MSVFELTTSTKAKLTDVDVLSQKNRPPDANPGVSLAFAMELPNSALTMLDGMLRSALYTKSEATETPTQPGLQGVEPISEMPNLTSMGRRLGNFSWDLELTGYTITFDYGMGGKSNLVIEDAKLDAFHIQPKEGGTVILKFKAEANDIDEAVFGKLATLKSRDVQIFATPPEIAPDLVKDPGADKAWPFPNDPKGDKPAEGAAPAAAKGAKGGKAAKAAAKDATEAFLGHHGTAGDEQQTEATAS